MRDKTGKAKSGFDFGDWFFAFAVVALGSMLASVVIFAGVYILEPIDFTNHNSLYYLPDNEYTIMEKTKSTDAGGTKNILVFSDESGRFSNYHQAYSSGYYNGTAYISEYHAPRYDDSAFVSDVTFDRFNVGDILTADEVREFFGTQVEAIDATRWFGISALCSIGIGVLFIIFLLLDGCWSI